MRIKLWTTFLEAPLITKTSVLVRTAFQSCAKGIFNGKCFILRKAFLDLFNIILSDWQEISECYCFGMIWKIVENPRMNRCLAIRKNDWGWTCLLFFSPMTFCFMRLVVRLILFREEIQNRPKYAHTNVCICICDRYLWSHL